ncbi:MULTISPECIES: archaeoflavoprotein AfpA [Methanobacterium]|jgi:archaeoflavoprotein AfpA|uniref:Archaeoflavoprotein AfpA n=1 Tax=Methanobacterium veterum TaxID=408577 RepID=A0A9E4ZT92_9EURY|nr:MULTISPECIES: archaeoflavoprotein AfpA [Methanobacterium]MCZ3365257.1 archaeoflavoprotein AfpA [Methanobacterium veterum]MCZ3373012.1 archaeoflavoprotein AfpA [Methanobacterium veterum]
MKKRKVAWGITGSGDKLVKITEIVRKIKEEYEDEFEIRAYVSKAGDQVLKYYGLFKPLEIDFDRLWVEINANAPFLAGEIQLGSYEFMLIAPATSNTVAKIALRIGDSLIPNAAIMGQKANIPIYVLPSDVEEGVTVTQLPDGSDLELIIRKEDVEHVDKLASMGIHILKSPEEIYDVFKKHANLKDS